MDEPQTPIQKLNFMLAMYDKTQNPLHLLCAFSCIAHIQTKGTNNDYVTIPRNMAITIADAFNAFLDGGCRGWGISAYSDEVGHLFRWKSATYSDGSRPGIPMKSATP